MSDSLYKISIEINLKNNNAIQMIMKMIQYPDIFQMTLILHCNGNLLFVVRHLWCKIAALEIYHMNWILSQIQMAPPALFRCRQASSLTGSSYIGIFLHHCPLVRDFCKLVFAFQLHPYMPCASLVYMNVVQYIHRDICYYFSYVRIAFSLASNMVP